MHYHSPNKENQAVQSLQKTGGQRTLLWLPWLIGQLYNQGLVVLLSVSELSLDLPFVFITKHL